MCDRIRYQEVGKRGGNISAMAINTIKSRQIGPHVQAEVRMRAATDIWKKIHDLNESDADRTKIAAAYLQLGDVLELLPERYRIVLSGSIEPEE